MCSFTDKELSEYVQEKRQHGEIETKRAVSRVGCQDNGLWVLNEKLIINADGKEVSVDDSPCIWLGHLYEGPGIAKNVNAITVPLPLDAKVLIELATKLKSIMEHNFFAALLLLGACVMSLHYGTILDKYLNCPVPIAFGPSGTGKTTAL